MDSKLIPLRGGPGVIPPGVRRLIDDPTMLDDETVIVKTATDQDKLEELAKVMPTWLADEFKCPAHGDQASALAAGSDLEAQCVFVRTTITGGSVPAALDHALISGQSEPTVEEERPSFECTTNRSTRTGGGWDFSHSARPDCRCDRHGRNAGKSSLAES